MTNGQQALLAKFAGCDTDDAPEKRSIWLMGIEHGWPKDAEKTRAENADDDSYSISMQRQWPYNRNAFKLLAVAHGQPVSEWESFAERHQPFVKGCQGYFKGNLYPFAAPNVGEWPESARNASGFDSKEEYRVWCREHRLPTIKRWVDEYTPSIVIGVGNTFRNEFAEAVFGRRVALEAVEAVIQGKTAAQKKRLYHAREDGLQLVVIPHLSGGRNGLNSDASLAWAGEIVRRLLSAA